MLLFFFLPDTNFSAHCIFPAKNYELSIVVFFFFGDPCSSGVPQETN